MTATSPGYSITVRAHMKEEGSGGAADIAAAVSAAGGSLTALDVVSSTGRDIVVDVTCDAIDGAHADRICAAISELPSTAGVAVLRCCTEGLIASTHAGW